MEQGVVRFLPKGKSGVLSQFGFSHTTFLKELQRKTSTTLRNLRCKSRKLMVQLSSQLTMDLQLMSFIQKETTPLSSKYLLNLFERLLTIN